MAPAVPLSPQEIIDRATALAPGDQIPEEGDDSSASMILFGIIGASSAAGAVCLVMIFMKHRKSKSGSMAFIDFVGENSSPHMGNTQHAGKYELQRQMTGRQMTDRQMTHMTEGSEPNSPRVKVHSAGHRI